MKIVFVLYDGMTQLDFTGPHQVFSRLPEAEIILASPKGGTVHTDGLDFSPTIALDEIDYGDLICVPGGVNAADMACDRHLVTHVRRLCEKAKTITSVCTGALILGAAGQLIGRKATTHWAWRHLLAPFGAEPVTGRVVMDGPLITGGGVTAGLDFAFTVVAKVAGEMTARQIQLMLEYTPSPPFDSGDPESADPALVSAYLRGLEPLMPARSAAVAKAAHALKMFNLTRAAK